MEIVFVLGFIALMIYGLRRQNDNLEDQSNLEVVYTDQIKGICKLASAPCEAALFRQSGHLYRVLGVFDCPDDALSEIEKSFKRANILSVNVIENNSSKLSVRRTYHNHRGRKEGRVLGGAIIVPWYPT